jgi:Domain of unknown function (DUF4149)
MKTLTISAISAWLGMLGFLAAVVAPAAFGVLERPVAARLIGWVMPRYHWAALSLGVLGLAGMVLRRGEMAGGWVDRLPLALVLVMLALTALSLFVLLPQIEALREAVLAARAAGVAGSPEAARFGRLHALSSLSGLGVLAAGVLVLLLEARRGGLAS